MSECRIFFSVAVAVAMTFLPVGNVVRRVRHDEAIRHLKRDFVFGSCREWRPICWVGKCAYRYSDLARQAVCDLDNDDPSLWTYLYLARQPTDMMFLRGKSMNEQAVKDLNRVIGAEKIPLEIITDRCIEADAISLLSSKFRRIGFTVKGTIDSDFTAALAEHSGLSLIQLVSHRIGPGALEPFAKSKRLRRLLIPNIWFRGKPEELDALKKVLPNVNIEVLPPDATDFHLGHFDN